MTDKVDERAKSIITITYVSVDGEGHLSRVLGINKDVRFPELFMGLVNKAVIEAFKSYNDIDDSITKLEDFN